MPITGNRSSSSERREDPLRRVAAGDIAIAEIERGRVREAARSCGCRCTRPARASRRSVVSGEIFGNVTRPRPGDRDRGRGTAAGRARRAGRRSGCSRRWRGRARRSRSRRIPAAGRIDEANSARRVTNVSMALLLADVGRRGGPLPSHCAIAPRTCRVRLRQAAATRSITTWPRKRRRTDQDRSAQRARLGVDRRQQLAAVATRGTPPGRGQEQAREQSHARPLRSRGFSRAMSTIRPSGPQLFAKRGPSERRSAGSSAAAPAGR